MRDRRVKALGGAGLVSSLIQYGSGGVLLWGFSALCGGHSIALLTSRTGLPRWSSCCVCMVTVPPQDLMKHLLKLYHFKSTASSLSCHLNGVARSASVSLFPNSKSSTFELLTGADKKNIRSEHSCLQSGLHSGDHGNACALVRSVSSQARVTSLRAD